MERKKKPRGLLRKILRLQAGATIGRGVKLNIRDSTEAGVPFNIEIQTTPYGSSVVQFSETETAKRNQRNSRSLRTETNPIKRTIKAWNMNNGFGSVVNTAVGNQLTVEMNGLYSTSSVRATKAYRGVSL